MEVKLKCKLDATALLGFADAFILYDMKRKATYYTRDFVNIIWEIGHIGGNAHFWKEMAFFTPSGKMVFVDLSHGDVVYTLPGIYIACENEKFILDKGGGRTAPYIVAFDYGKKKRIWKKKYSVSASNYLHSDYIYSVFFGEHYRLEQAVSCINASNGEIVWQHSIQDLPPYTSLYRGVQQPNVEDIFGVYNDVLWIHICGPRLLGIDIYTGERKYFIEDITLEDSEGSFFDAEHGILRTLGYNYYAEFDLKTLKFIRQVKIQMGVELTIRGSNYYPNDRYMYFCGHYNKSTLPNAVGIFDTEKAEIIWFHVKEDEEGYFYHPPKSNGKYIVVDDEHHNLRIYECGKNE
jgi:hypothetical protein